MAHRACLVIMWKASHRNACASLIYASMVLRICKYIIKYMRMPVYWRKRKLRHCNFDNKLWRF